MPNISKKGQGMPPSPIRKLVPYAEEAKKKGIHVIHLNIGQPDIKTPKVALDAVRNHGVEVLAYSMTEGSEGYRKKIAAYYRKNNIEVDSNHIIVTTGGSEALFFAMGTIMDNGEEVIVPEPFYANYNGFAVASGVKIVPVVSTLENNFALPPIADIEKLISPKTKAVLVCNPVNPTGYLYSKEEIHQLAELAKKHNLFLVADEVYREFTYDGTEHYSILQVPEFGAHAIVVDSVSKRYSMCGARIGCLVSKNSDIIQTALKFAQARLSPPTFGQMASEAALETPQAYFDHVIGEYTERRDTLVSELQKIAGVRVAVPKGAFYCIVELPIPNAEDFAQWLLENFEMDGKTVMVAPAAGFYATKGLGENQIRIAYVLEKEQLVTAVNLIGEALKKYSRK